jgi:hypothetical protein
MTAAVKKLDRATPKWRQFVEVGAGEMRPAAKFWESIELGIDFFVMTVLNVDPCHHLLRTSRVEITWKEPQTHYQF